jgi:hypothetical protein
MKRFITILLVALFTSAAYSQIQRPPQVLLQLDNTWTGENVFDQDEGGSLKLKAGSYTLTLDAPASFVYSDWTVGLPSEAGTLLLLEEIDTFGELDDLVSDKILANLEDDQLWTGVQTLGESGIPVNLVAYASTWDLVAEGSFIFYDDGPAPMLTIDGANNSIEFVNSTVEFNGLGSIDADTAVMTGFTIDGDDNTIQDLDVNDLTVGTPTAEAGLFRIGNTAPQFWFQETDAATNSKWWGFSASAGVFYGYLGSDFPAEVNNWITVTRSGTTLTDVSMDGPMDFGGTATYSGGGSDFNSYSDTELLRKDAVQNAMLPGGYIGSYSFQSDTNDELPVRIQIAHAGAISDSAYIYSSTDLGLAANDVLEIDFSGSAIPDGGYYVEEVGSFTAPNDTTDQPAGGPTNGSINWQTAYGGAVTVYWAKITSGETPATITHGEIVAANLAADTGYFAEGEIIVVLTASSLYNQHDIEIDWKSSEGFNSNYAKKIIQIERGPINVAFKLREWTVYQNGSGSTTPPQVSRLNGIVETGGGDEEFIVFCHRSLVSSGTGTTISYRAVVTSTLSSNDTTVSQTFDGP